jgi:ribonuclease G
VFLPQDNHIGVSQKIPPPSAMPCASAAAAHRHRRRQATGGFILRTNAEDASDEELAEDIAYLRKTWLRIKEAATRQPPPRCCTRT